MIIALIIQHDFKIVMGYIDELLDGMSSVYDLTGEKHFNKFKKYPGKHAAIRNIWFNVGCHIDNATNKLAKENELPNSPFKRKCTFEDY